MAREYIEKYDLLNTGREKLNRSIDKSYNAEETSVQALKDANDLGNQAISDANKLGNEAKQISIEKGNESISIAKENEKVANEANLIAQDTNDRMNQIISGTTDSAEIIDARKPTGLEPTETLGERLNLQFGNSGDFRENETSLITKMKNEFFETGYNIKHFKVAGDGLTDDSDKIQNAINIAATENKGLNFFNGTFLVSKNLLLKNGLKYIRFHNDAKLLVKENCNYLNIITDYTQWDDEDDKVDGVILYNIMIDMNKTTGSSGIKIKSKKAVIKKCKIYNFTGSGNRGIRLTFGASENEVSWNFVVMPTQYDGHTDNQCISVIGNAYSQNAGLENHDTVQDGTLTCYSNKIFKNTCIGGVHSIALNQSYNNDVYDNYVGKSTARGIIMSPRACNNRIFRNKVIDSGSTGIHLAFGSDNNDIYDNLVIKNEVSTVSESDKTGSFYGEAGIQNYKYCKGNKIHNNTVISRWYYGISIAVALEDVEVYDNDVSGGILAGISFESDFLPTTKQWKYGRPNFEEPINKNWATWSNGNSMKNITIIRNTVKKLNEPKLKESTNFNIHQNGGNSSFDNIFIENNISISFDEGQEFVYNANKPELNRSININRNSLTENIEKNVTINNRDLIASTYKDNSWQNSTFRISSQPDYNVIDMSITNYIIINSNISVGSILGMITNGRSVFLILNKGAKILSNKGNILLKNNIDYEANIFDVIFELKYLEPVNKWVEVSRTI